MTPLKLSPRSSTMERISPALRDAMISLFSSIACARAPPPRPPRFARMSCSARCEPTANPRHDANGVGGGEQNPTMLNRAFLAARAVDTVLASARAASRATDAPQLSSTRRYRSIHRVDTAVACRRIQLCAGLASRVDWGLRAVKSRSDCDAESLVEARSSNVETRDDDPARGAPRREARGFHRGHRRGVHARRAPRVVEDR